MISAQQLSNVQILPSVAGSQWSKAIYQKMSTLQGGVNDCASLCQLASSPTCHFYLFLSGICFLGNSFTTNNVIAARTDARNISVLDGKPIWFTKVNSCRKKMYLKYQVLFASHLQLLFSSTFVYRCRTESYLDT